MTILGAGVGGETVMHACVGTTGPRSVILGQDLTGRGGAFIVEGALGFICFPNHSPLVYGSL
jgi:hypothetical protein